MSYFWVNKSVPFGEIMKASDAQIFGAIWNYLELLSFLAENNADLHYHLSTNKVFCGTGQAKYKMTWGRIHKKMVGPTFSPMQM